jgi:hypothetical protein
LRQLAKKFLDANGNLDEETCIESRYSTHVLTWSFGQFKKMFTKLVSGLPELLFNKGFLLSCTLNYWSLGIKSDTV